MKAQQRVAAHHSNGFGKGDQTGQDTPSSAGIPASRKPDNGPTPTKKAQNAEQSREWHADHASRHFDRFDPPFLSLQTCLQTCQGCGRQGICQSSHLPAMGECKGQRNFVWFQSEQPAAHSPVCLKEGHQALAQQGCMQTRGCELIQGNKNSIRACLHARRLLSDTEAAELRSTPREFREAEGPELPAAWKGASCLITGPGLVQVHPATTPCQRVLLACASLHLVKQQGAVIQAASVCSMEFSHTKVRRLRECHWMRMLPEELCGFLGNRFVTRQCFVRVHMSRPLWSGA